MDMLQWLSDDALAADADLFGDDLSTDLFATSSEPIASTSALSPSTSLANVDFSSMDVDKEFGSLMSLLELPALGHSQSSTSDSSEPPTPAVQTVSLRDVVFRPPPMPVPIEAPRAITVKNVTPTPKSAAAAPIPLALPARPFRTGNTADVPPPARAPAAVPHPAAPPRQAPAAAPMSIPFPPMPPMPFMPTPAQVQADPRLAAQMQMMQAQAVAQMQMQMHYQMQMAAAYQRHQQQQQQQARGFAVPMPYAAGPVRTPASSPSKRAAPYNAASPSRTTKHAQSAQAPQASAGPSKVRAAALQPVEAEDLVTGWIAPGDFLRPAALAISRSH